MSAPFQWIEDIVEIIDADEKISPTDHLDSDGVFEEIAEHAKEIFTRNPDMGDPREAFIAAAAFFSYTFAATGQWDKAIEEIDDEDEDEDTDD